MDQIILNGWNCKVRDQQMGSSLLAQILIFQVCCSYSLKKNSYLVLYLFCCINQASGDKEELRYLLWIRLTRVRKVFDFFQKMERDIRINYLFARIVKLIAVELYCTHTAACIFYYLATTLPPEQEGYTWIGSLKLGDYSYSQFREIDIWKRYITSLYFAIVTMATVGKSLSFLQ